MFPVLKCGYRNVKHMRKFTLTEPCLNSKFFYTHILTSSYSILYGIAYQYANVSIHTAAQKNKAAFQRLPLCFNCFNRLPDNSDNHFALSFLSPPVDLKRLTMSLPPRIAIMNIIRVPTTIDTHVIVIPTYILA